ncbi:rho family-interacting cell polarization regulator 2 isoform X2 [Parasteatoda tepidariorum]|uniref:rho family-interacting cell polarization regulator 2 isoform X2 n=1 Tax=Parasteatoda tepidariorum TaxID=114398 RepID=UPI001C719C2E|nr:rho family-interacting cell polarization regulator 2 isoform X2 [Parasteatoda tepidariorum]
MSLNEKKCPKQLPDIYLTESICRSKSFGGLSHRRTNSADATFASAKEDVSYDGSLRFDPNSALNSPKSSSWSSWIQTIKKSSRLNKSPQPERTQLIFDTICKGLHESIKLVQSEISDSRIAFDNISVSSVTSQGRLYEFEKQMKANERYLKKLEFHLSKLDELKEQYDVQQRIRDGIRTMGYAYILSPGKQKEAALQKVRSEFKDSTEIMCTYEKKLETLMGTLLFEMIGIQGFARICAGDVFEVTIKHGDQRWKSRGRVVKNGEQIWENKTISFKSFFREPLSIKAVEVRGLGKNILLGNKVCETRDLFCAHPQQMTINLNPSGSLKLNLIITWHPLNAAQDGMPFQMSHSIGRNSHSLSMMHESDQFSDFSSSVKQNLLQNSSFCDNSGLNQPAQTNEEIPKANDTKVKHSLSCDSVNCSSNCLLQNGTELKKNSNLNDSQTWSIPLSEDISDSHSVSQSEVTLPEVFKYLTLLLNEFTETYDEIVELAAFLEELNLLLRGKECNTSGSNVSISVESALGCFDFLNTAIENEEQDTSNDRMSEDGKNTTDQSNEAVELEKQFQHLDICPLALTSGNEEIDIVLTEHLSYITILVSSVHFNLEPFKCLQKSTLEKIRRQIVCLYALTDNIKNEAFTTSDLFCKNQRSIYQLWTSICGNKMYCTSDHFSLEMESVLRAKAVLDNYMASTVAPRLVCDIVDCNEFDPALRVTVLHLKNFFWGHFTPDDLLVEYVADSLATEDLKCQDVQKAFCAVSVLSKIIPSTHALFQIGCFLINSSVDLRNIAASYLRAVSTNEEWKEKVIFSYLKMMQQDNAKHRLISCKALEVLEVKNNIGVEQLSFLMNNDEDSDVRNAAYAALLSLGKVK